MTSPNLKCVTVAPSGRPSQRGVSLLFALLALAAMLLAAVALVRSVDSGGLVLGNLGFKQEATSAGDIAAERARTFLTSGVNLNADRPGDGYYASSLDALDLTGSLTSAITPMAVVNWGDADSCACLSTTPATCSACTVTPSNAISLNGGRVAARYVIARLCPSVGAPTAANACARPAALALSQAASRGELEGGVRAPAPTAAMTPYYRIVVRSVGSRNTVSFTETIIH